MLCPAGITSAKSEDITEYIAEAGKYILKIRPLISPALETFMTIGIIYLAFAIVAKNLVSLGRLLEPLFRFPVPRIPVRMVFHGLLAIGLFDIFSRSRP
jgi:hypothetical protein